MTCANTVSSGEKKLFKIFEYILHSNGILQIVQSNPRWEEEWGTVREATTCSMHQKKQDSNVSI